MSAGRCDRGTAPRLLRHAKVCVASFALAAIGASACLADGKPGDLLAQTSIPGAPDGATAWRIRYRTLDEKEHPVEVTGMVIVPNGQAPKGTRDVVAWGRGTVGLAPVCAPSKTPEKVFEKTPGIPAMLKRGFVIAAPDFADPDSPRPHPYLVGLDEAHAMLDIVRAADQMASAAAGKRYALSGESEGAHAALWAAKLAPTYAPDLTLVGVAVAAPPTDLIANFDGIKNPGVRALMTGYVSDSWSKVYGIPLSTFANPIGRFFIRRLAKDCTRFDLTSTFSNVGFLVLSGQVPNKLGEPWTKPLRENSLKAWHLGVPLLVAQGGQDDVVVPALTKRFVTDSCGLGVTVHSIVMPDAGHLDIAEKVTVPTVDWIAARFEGKPAGSDCAALPKAAGNDTPRPVAD